MKKLLLFCVLFIAIATNAQTDFTTILSGGSTSPNGRAPQGTKTVCRSVWIITATEMATAGFTGGETLSGLGFNYKTGQDVETTGNFVVYMENSADATNTKSTTWDDAISTMTQVSSSSITVPVASGTFDVSFPNGSTFSYTGGALYIAFDYQNLAGGLAVTPNVALCQSTLAGGILGAMSTDTTLPTLLTASAFRPFTRLGVPVTCSKPTNQNAVTTSNTADLSWSTTGTAELEWGDFNFTQGTGTTVTGLISSTTLSGLLPSSVYDYYVRTDCGAGNFSTWSGPYAFHTVFEPTTPVYNTGFEQLSLPFIGWTTSETVTTSSPWFINIATSASPLVQEGTSSAVALSNTTAASNSWLLSRGVNLVAGTPVTITYYIRNYLGTGSTGNGKYRFTVGNAQTSAAQTTVILNTTAVSSTTFALKTLTYTPTTTGVYYFGFNNTSALNAGTQGLIVDNFTVTQSLATGQFEANQFSVSPNPANDIIAVSNSNNILINGVKILDLNGRIVKQLNFKNVTSTQINVSDFTPGIYFMNIGTDQGNVTKKIIKN